MHRALFVSDIHISAPDDPRARAFGAFLDHCLKTRPTHLFLVGDIFDLWIADRAYFVGRYAELIDRVKRLVEGGCEVHYFEGNHDLDLARFWRDELKVHVHDRPQTFALAGRRVRVEHGDQMDPADRGYHVLRWFLRTWLMRTLGRYLPNPLVRRIGERASLASRAYTSEVKTASDERTRAVIRAHVEHLNQREAFDVFVAGHVHVREDVTIGGARVFNLGTWLKDPLVLELTEQALQLRPLADFK